MAKNFTYTKSPVSVDRLTQEIRQSAITVSLDHIDLFGDNLDIFFKADLSVEDKALLDAIVAAHTGEPVAGEDARSIAIAEQESSYTPSPLSYKIGKTPIVVDAEQKQTTRGQVLTDEGSFRDDFSGTSLFKTLSGTFDFNEESDVVTFSGADIEEMNVLYPYFKMHTDPDSAFTQGQVLSSSALSLEEHYLGSTGSGSAIMSNWFPSIEENGSISVSDSWLILNANGANSSVSLYKSIDYLPIRLNFKIKVSSRVSGSEFSVGLVDEVGVVKCIASFTGTDNTKVTFWSFSESGEFDKQQTTATLPLAKITSEDHIYSIEVVSGKCSLFVDDILIATHRDHVPDSYDTLGIMISAKNTSTATISCDWISFQNVDQIDVANSFANTPLKVDLVSPKALDGKPIISSSPRPIGTYSVFTSVGDSQANQSAIAGGDLLSLSHAINDAAVQTLYMDINSIINETHIYKATVQWSGAKHDLLECDIVTKASVLGDGVATDYAVINHVLIMAPGLGNKTVDFNTVNLVQMVPNEYGVTPAGYWDATYNTTTKAFENIVFNPNGKGAFNIFDAEVVVNKFVPAFVMLGNGWFTFDSDDVTRIGHNFRLKTTLTTRGDNHAWDFCGNVFLYRKKT